MIKIPLKMPVGFMPDIYFIQNSKSSWIENLFLFLRQEKDDLSCQIFQALYLRKGEHTSGALMSALEEGLMESRGTHFYPEFFCNFIN